MLAPASIVWREGALCAVLIDGNIDEGSLGDFDLRGRASAFAQISTLTEMDVVPVLAISA